MTPLSSCNHVKESIRRLGIQDFQFNRLSYGWLPLFEIYGIVSAWCILMSSTLGMSSRLRPFIWVFDIRKIHVRPSEMDALEGMMPIRLEWTICQLPDFSLLRISKSTMASGMTPRTRVCVPRIRLASAQERAPSTKVRIMPMWYMDFLNAPLSPSLSAW